MKSVADTLETLALHITVVGEVGVGKTAFCRSLMKKPFNENRLPNGHILPVTTFLSTERHNVSISFTEYHENQNIPYIYNADMILLCLDSTVAPDNNRKTLQKFLGYAKERAPGVPCCVLLTKADLQVATTPQEVEYPDCFVLGTCSAKKGATLEWQHVRHAVIHHVLQDIKKECLEYLAKQTKTTPPQLLQLATELSDAEILKNDTYPLRVERYFHHITTVLSLCTIEHDNFIRNLESLSVKMALLYFSQNPVEHQLELSDFVFIYSEADVVTMLLMTCLRECSNYCDYPEFRYGNDQAVFNNRCFVQELCRLYQLEFKFEQDTKNGERLRKALPIFEPAIKQINIDKFHTGSLRYHIQMMLENPQLMKTLPHTLKLKKALEALQQQISEQHMTYKRK